MNRKQYFVIVSCLIMASYSHAAVPVTVEVLEVRKIWDQAPHNAFTDLVRWKDALYCAFREGRGHVSTDGRIRILESKDTDTWTSVASISSKGFDLRDAHLSVTPDGRLMLIGGATPREKDNQLAPTGTFVSFTKDGRQWTQPQIAVEPGRWLWCVTWHEGKAYGVSYTAGKGSDRYLDLLISDDGINYEQHVPKLFDQGYPTEVTLRFDSDGTCYALVRRDRIGDEPSSAMLGISRPDYKQWQWKDLGSEFNGFGGPNFIQIPGGHWLAAGRMHDGGAHTALCYLDIENGTMTRLLKLPSGGDTSYPGMVWHNDILYVSYYSSHEGKTSIYLAKIKTGPTGLCKITGMVRDEKGKPVAGTEVRRLHGPGPVETDAEGNYELVWDPQRNRPLVDTYYIIARHWQKNLSIVVEVPEFEQGTEIVNLNLQPGVTFKGKIVDPAGRGIDQAGISILLHTPTQGSGLYNTITDYEGLFEFRGMPTGHKYSFATWAPGHGTKWVHDIYAGHNYAQKDFMLEPMTLAIADQSVSGVVVDANDKPVSGMLLWTDGEGQPNLNVRTDMEGKFTIDKVCTGDLRIYAMVHIENPPSGYVLTYGGATDVRIVVKDVPSPDRQRIVPKTPPSLVGKALPELKDLGIRLPPTDVDGKQILLCFFDLQQRPSRNCIIQLAKRTEELKEKGVAIIAIQTFKIDEKMLNDWVKENGILFTISMIGDDEEKTRFNWGVKSLPWLILTDAEHIVHVVGFGIDQLDTELAKTDQPITKEEVEKHQREVAEVEIRRLGGEIIVKTSENGSEYTEVKFLGPRYQNEWKGGNLGAKYLSGLCNLKNLRIQDVETFTDEGMVYLEGLNNLESLMLVRTQVTDNGLACIKELTNLEFLGLMSNKFTDTGLEHIIGMTNLKSLRLDDTEVTNDGLKRLKENGLFSALEFLSLNRTKISNEGLAHLTGMQKLKRLYLSDTQITSVGLDYIGGLTKLEVLNLTNTDISDEGLLHLKTLADLNMLYLRNTKITSKGLAHLEKMTDLIQLWISGTKVTESGLVYLKALNKLESLDLSHTQVTNSGLSHLEGLTSLNELFLNYSGVTIDGYLDLNEALPDCQIYWEEKKNNDSS